MGNNSDPITLHKYLYANADPGNMVDPSGNFSMGSMMSAINVMGTLSTIATTTYDVFQIATGEEELTAKKIGSAILFNMIGAKAGKVLGLFNKRFVDKFRAACGRNSFSSGTLVHGENGLRPIEEISIGDLVWATDPETDESGLKAVTHLIQGDQEYELFKMAFENGEVITATADHPFFSEGQWVNAQNLKVGNSVLVLGNVEPVIISSIQKEVKQEEVFNLTVDGLHTFHIGEAGYLVHNQNQNCSLPGIFGVNRKLSHQKQSRHIQGGKGWDSSKSYMNSIEDAQKVLDDVHNGSAFVLGKTKQGHIVVKHPGITGFNNNIGSGQRNQITNVFLIKGTKSPSVVPTSPAKEFAF
jgi:hypothetical protein